MYLVKVLDVFHLSNSTCIVSSELLLLILMAWCAYLFGYTL
jgi:hypothetical protein